mmetsp:Transcript_38260/g.103630  ORF Transcript_38260/g.103630 Transcript_38260/m.103630 type:complete len:219 (-) Transcript_38260:38-694(-)
MVARRRVAAVRPGVKSDPKLKLTSAGQAFLSSGLCIATSRTGKPCLRKCGGVGVPYCAKCMKTGDPSLRVVDHPKAGKILIAARDLPKGYRVALWGRARKKKDVKAKAMEWSFDITNGWMIDPTGCRGSLVQFCACPGPNEAAAIYGTPTTRCDHTAYGCWVFITGQPLPRMWQLTMQYGSNSKGSDEFFKERGLTRLDVGTPKYPALRRKDAEPLRE